MHKKKKKKEKETYTEEILLILRIIRYRGRCKQFQRAAEISRLSILPSARCCSVRVTSRNVSSTRILLSKGVG